MQTGYRQPKPYLPITRWSPRFWAMILITSIGAATAQEATLDQVQQAQENWLDAGAAAQQRIDSLDDERTRLAREYRVTLNQVSRLERFNESQQKIIASQEQAMQSLREQITSVASLERNIVPLMEDMVEALDKFIRLDAPFLLEERLARVNKLRVLLVEADMSNAEKYRRIMEAYQIENDYGRTIESYQNYLDPDQPETSPLVNFLKIGRVSFLYQTLDEKASYFWSPEERQWIPLEDGYNAPVTRGIKMANEQIPSNLLSVPVIAAGT